MSVRILEQGLNAVIGAFQRPQGLLSVGRQVGECTISSTIETQVTQNIRCTVYSIPESVDVDAQATPTHEPCFKLLGRGQDMLVCWLYTLPRKSERGNQVVVPRHLMSYIYSLPTDSLLYFECQAGFAIHACLCDIGGTLPKP